MRNRFSPLFTDYMSHSANSLQATSTSIHTVKICMHVLRLVRLTHEGSNIAYQTEQTAFRRVGATFTVKTRYRQYLQRHTHTQQKLHKLF